MTDKQLKIVSSQLNTAVNDIRGNVDLIKGAYEDARNKGADLLVTPELSISGYPLADSVSQPDLLRASLLALNELKALSKKDGPALLVGLPYLQEDGSIYNMAVLLHEGMIKGSVSKQHLPNYDVFDEKRNFAPGPKTVPMEFKGFKLGVLICEDLWYQDVSKELKDKGADVLVSLNSSPFEAGKLDKRLNEVIYNRVKETGLPFLYVNQVGGQDEIVFDGYSTAINSDGSLAYLAKGFTEVNDMLTLKANENSPAKFNKSSIAKAPSDNLETIWKALVTGTKDYFKKTGHKQAVIGMSGGIDSAVVAAIAVDALGPDNVKLYRLPSQFTSGMSNDDADIAAKMLGTSIKEIAIQPMFKSFQQSLKSHFDDARADSRDHQVDTALENLQARIRGTILMSLSNAGEGLLLTTGNKSEVSVGYCTLYGDTNGGFNPLKDVYKMMAYDLAKWRNKNYPDGVLGPNGKVMPDNIITRPPSAELAEDQVDTNSLPPYEVLDEILKGYIENQQSPHEIAHNTAQPLDLVKDIVKKVDNAEFKRQQAAPGIKISSKSFGKGRRYPIAQPPLSSVMNSMKI
jgi:NAD+ synthase